MEITQVDAVDIILQALKKRGFDTTKAELYRAFPGHCNRTLYGVYKNIESNFQNCITCLDRLDVHFSVRGGKPQPAVIREHKSRAAMSAKLTENNDLDIKECLHSDDSATFVCSCGARFYTEQLPQRCSNCEAELPELWQLQPQQEMAPLN